MWKMDLENHLQWCSIVIAVLLVLPEGHDTKFLVSPRYHYISDAERSSAPVHGDIIGNNIIEAVETFEDSAVTGSTMQIQGRIEFWYKKLLDLVEPSVEVPYNGRSERVTQGFKYPGVVLIAAYDSRNQHPIPVEKVKEVALVIARDLQNSFNHDERYKEVKPIIWVVVEESEVTIGMDRDARTVLVTMGLYITQRFEILLGSRPLEDDGINVTPFPWGALQVSKEELVHLVEGMKQIINDLFMDTKQQNHPQQTDNAWWHGQKEFGSGEIKNVSIAVSYKEEAISKVDGPLLRLVCIISISMLSKFQDTILQPLDYSDDSKISPYYEIKYCDGIKMEILLSGRGQI